MLSRFLLVLLACLSLAFIATPAQAQQVQLAWDAPVQANGTPVPNLAGYKLYYGSQSGQYPSMIQVGLKTAYTITNLSAGQTYYFAAKAYDTTGLESGFSNEVSVTLPQTPPSMTLSAAPPEITVGQATTLTWAASQATSCSAPWTTSKATSGSQSVTPTATTTYTMSCTGAGGTTSANTTVSINTPVGKLIPQQQLRVVSVDSQDMVGGNYAATNAFDANPATMWHTEWARRAPAPPHTLVLDLGARYQVDGFHYLPRQDGNPNGTIAGYEFYVSDDDTTWGTAVATGTLAANTSEKTVRFTAKTGRYVRLVALSEINGKPYTSAAEFNIFGATAPSSTTTTSDQSVKASPVMSSTPTSTTTGSNSTTAASPTSASQPTTKTASAPVSSSTSSASTPAMTASQNTRWEMTLTSTKTYNNPFTDVIVTVEYTKAGSPPCAAMASGMGARPSNYARRSLSPAPGTTKPRPPTRRIAAYITAKAMCMYSRMTAPIRSITTAFSR